jgi:MFS family permease
MHRLVERVRASGTALRGVAGNRDLRRIQLAYVGSEVGGWVAMIGLSVVAYADAGLTGFGVVFALRMVPPMVGAPFMGVLADRLPRRRVMLASDAVNTTLMLAAAALVFADGPLALILALLSVVSIAGTAFRPAQAALLPQLAKTPEELTAANAVSSTIESVTAFAGPALGGVLVAVTEPGYAFLFTAATFLWSAALVFGVREPARESDADGPVWSPAAIVGELRDGGRALVGDRGVGLLVGLIGAQVVVSGVLLVLLAGLAFEELGTGDAGFGWLLSGLGVGGLLGAVAALGLAGLDLVRSFAVGVALWGVPIALLAAWQSSAGAFVLVAAVGFANTLVDVSAFTLLQRAVPDDVLARVFGILESVMYAATVLGALAAPALVGLIDLDAALIIAGVFLPLLVVLSWPVLRRLDLAPPPTAELDLLRGVPFLALLAPVALEHLAGALGRVSVPAGTDVFAQGDAGDRFYVVAEGTVVVRADGEVIHEGGPGYYFGEIALLRDAPRMASVYAESDVQLLSLERDEFLGAVTGHAESVDAADAVIASRLRATRPALAQL